MAENTYTVRREISINAAPARVYELIADFRSWTAWSPWEDVDPAMSRTYSGADSGTGARYGWSGNRKAGQGHMEITHATPPTRVDIDLVFEKPWKARNDTFFQIEPEGAGSKVLWSMTGRKTLLTKAMGVFKSMESFLGPDFDKGLARLKSRAESSDR